MTSANFIAKRPNVYYGPWYDHYIRPWGECHPDYTGIPIGKSTGVKVCVRTENRTAENPNLPRGKRYFEKQENVYYPEKNETREFNNLPREKRKIPEQVIHYVREMNCHKFLGTGI